MKNFRLLKRTRQTTEYSCGASALQSVLLYWGKDVDEHELMKLMGTTEEEGTYPEKIVHAARALGFEAEARANMTLEDVEKFTAEGHPIVALGQFWRTQSSVSSVDEDWDNGHYIVLLGVDETHVYFQDPYARMSKAFVPRKTFEAHWHQVMGGDLKRNPKLEHLGILIHGKQPASADLTEEAGLAKLDFTKLGSLNVIVTRFPGWVFPMDLLDDLKTWLSNTASIRPNAFIFLHKDKDGAIAGMEGSGLQEDADAAELNAVITAITSRMVDRADDATTSAKVEAALKAAAQGDFGLSAGDLRKLGDQLAAGHSALIVLFENVWERKFREIIAKHDGSVFNQRLLTPQALAEAAQRLAAAR
jgi:uncharacterized protein